MKKLVSCKRTFVFGKTVHSWFHLLNLVLWGKKEKDKPSVSHLKFHCLRMTSKNTAKDLYNGCGMTPTTVHSFLNKSKLCIVTRIEQGTFKLLVNHIKGDEL